MTKEIGKDKARKIKIIHSEKAKEQIEDIRLPEKVVDRLAKAISKYY